MHYQGHADRYVFGGCELKSLPPPIFPENVGERGWQGGEVYIFLKIKGPKKIFSKQG